MTALDIEKYLVKEVLLNTVLCFFTPLEIARSIKQHHITIRKYLNQMEQQKIVVRHKYRCAYRLDRDYYNSNYIVKPLATVQHHN